MKTPLKHAGVTLLELMVVIAVAGILLAVGVPSFNNFILDSRRIGLGNDLLAAMMLARSESIKQGQGITVCASTDGVNCASTSSGWNSGWIVQGPTTAQVIRYVKNDSGSAAVTSSVAAIAFQQFGSCQVQAGSGTPLPCATSTVTVRVCDTQKSNYNGSLMCRGSKVVVQTSGVATLRSTDSESPNPCAC
jgi:type IV fimbrial biogenesis protein FimT